MSTKPTYEELEQRLEEAERARDEMSSFYKALFDQSPDAIGVMDLETGFLTVHNAQFCDLIGYSPEEVSRLKINDIDVNETEEETLRHVARIVEQGSHVFETRYRTKQGVIRDVVMNAVHVRVGSKDYIQGLCTDITKKKKLEREREELIARLEKAFESVKRLSGLLPLCSYCKKIRDDKGYWNRVDIYITEHSDALISHGICPECARERYPDLNLDFDLE